MGENNAKREAFADEVIEKIKRSPDRAGDIAGAVAGIIAGAITGVVASGSGMEPLAGLVAIAARHHRVPRHASWKRPRPARCRCPARPGPALADR